MATLLKTYKRGMKTGNIEDAFRSWATTNYVAYLTGYPLGPLDSSMSKLLEQMQQYGVSDASSIHFQFLLRHLIGNSGEPLDWTKEMKSKFIDDASNIEA